jgi:hypothetical protein
MCGLKKSIFITVCFLLSIVFSTRAEDVESWTFVGGETKIENMEFSFHSANFFGHNFGYFLNHTQVSLDFPSKHNFSFGIGYKQEYVDLQITDKWRAEYRPMLHLFYNKSWGNISFRDRSRWEFRFINGKLTNRYRNQVLLAFNKFKAFTPYVSTEFSFYFNELGYSRQRSIVGAEIPIKNLKLNLFFGYQVDEVIPDHWYNKFMVGTGLSYSF